MDNIRDMWENNCGRLIVGQNIQIIISTEPDFSQRGRVSDVKGYQVYRQRPMFSTQGPHVNLSSDIFIVIGICALQRGAGGKGGPTGRGSGPARTSLTGGKAILVVMNIKIYTATSRLAALRAPHALRAPVFQAQEKKAKLLIEKSAKVLQLRLIYIVQDINCWLSL